jgi:hypothetical protein
MAELIGALASGITLAGLFKICVDTFGIIRTCKNQERDLKKLTLRLNIERCRLYNWGEAMRLTRSDKQRSPLEDYPGKNIVQETLETIFQLLNDTQKIESIYGCRQLSDLNDTDDKPMELEGPEESPVTVLAASFSNFGNLINAKPQTLHKTRWVVYDRKKFSLLMIELKELVDGLQDITGPLVSVAKLGSMMRKAIRSIRDVDTLTLVSEVTKDDHPNLSVAASAKAETVSMPASTWRDIASWTNAVHVHDGLQVDITEEIEGMDITELKARLLRDSLEQQHREHDYHPPPKESPTYGRPFDNQYLSMSVNPMFRPETTERVPYYAPYQRTAWSQDQGQDHIATPGNLSQQQLYDLHAYKLKLEVSALEEAARKAAAREAATKEAAATKKVSTEEKIPAKEAPIIFHDAYQRSYKLPFHLCEKWRVSPKSSLYEN